MTIANRLDEAMQAAGIPSQSALARASGIPQPTINRILKGVGKKGPEAHTVAELAKACNVSFTWLFEGVGPMARSAPSTDDGDSRTTVQVKDDDDSEFVRVQLVKNFLHAGLGGMDGDFEPDDDVSVTIPRSWLLERGVSAQTVKALRIKGLSMYPTLRPGTIAIVNLADRVPVAILRNPDRTGVEELRDVLERSGIAHPFEQTIENAVALADGGIRQDEHEFLAANPAEAVRTAHELLHLARKVE